MNRVTEVPKPPTRTADAHKGSAGLVLVVAGSRGMAGAAALVGNASLKTGAGLVKIATPDSILDTVAVLAPCCTTTPLPDDGTSVTRDAGDAVLRLAKDRHVVAVGPGLGQTGGVAATVTAILSRSSVPIVLDADGLNVLGRNAAMSFSQVRQPLVITPHPGEAARLLGKSTKDVQANRETAAQELAAMGPVVVLKGHGTIVCDAKRMFINNTGNPGMATAGSGDVLTGMIAALVAAGMTAFDAAVLAVNAHGRAGDLAAGKQGVLGLTAIDILDAVPAALKA
jgi:ADP-dependent NAD(P)H-hydrate dehydratase